MGTPWDAENTETCICLEAIFANGHPAIRLPECSIQKDDAQVSAREAMRMDLDYCRQKAPVVFPGVAIYLFDDKTMGANCDALDKHDRVVPADRADECCQGEGYCCGHGEECG